MRWLRKVLVLLSSTNLILAEIEPVNFEKFTILEPCLLSLAEKYFSSHEKSAGSLVIVNLLPSASHFQTRVLRSFNEDNDHKLGIMVKDALKKHGNASHVTERAKNYMMLLENGPEEIAPTLEMWKRLPTWNPLATTLIFFMNPINGTELKNKMIRQTFSLLLEQGMIYCNAMFQMADEPVKMIVESWFPYQGEGCAKEVGRIHVIDECTVPETDFVGSEKNVKSVNDQMFPKLPNTLHGCEMRVSAFIWAPFTVASASRKLIKSGLEFEMLRTITSQMRMNLEIDIRNSSITTKRVTQNQTKIYSDLIQKKSDILVGGLFENPVSRKLVSSSIPYFQDDITWCVAKAGLAPSWLNVFIIFNTTTWIGLLVTFMVASVCLYFFARREGKYRENYVWSFLMIVLFGTGQYAHYWPTRGEIQLYLIALFFFGMHINTAYHSFLITVLTNPRYNEQINTVERGIDAGITFQVAESTVEFFEKEDFISKHLLKHHEICENLDECFKNISTGNSRALAISRAHALNNPFRMNENEDIFCFPISDDVVIYSAVMMFQRHHHLLSTINKKIRSIAESGLLMKWQKENSREAAKSDNSRSGHGDGKQMKLRLDHVEGAFFLGLIGLGVSFVVFLLELLTAWNTRRKKDYRLLKKFERLFCHA